MRFDKNGQIISAPMGKKDQIYPDPDVKKLMTANQDAWYDYEDKNDNPAENKNQAENSNSTPKSDPLANTNPQQKKGLFRKISEQWTIIKNSKIYALFIILNLGWTVAFSYFVLTNTKATKDGLAEAHTAFSQTVGNWQNSALSYIYLETPQSQSHSWLGLQYQWEYSGVVGQYYGFAQSYSTADTPLAKLYGDYTSFTFYDDANKYDSINGCPNGYFQCGGEIDSNYITCLPNGSKCPINHIFSMKIFNLNYTTSREDNITSCQYTCPVNASCTFNNPSTQNISNFTIEGKLYQSPASAYIQVDFEGNTYFVIFTSELTGWWINTNTSSNAAVLYPYSSWLDGNYSTIIFWSYNHNDYPISEFAVNEYKMCNDKTQENVTPGRAYTLIGDISFAYDKKVNSPCGANPNNFSWIVLDHVSELQYCINNGLFSTDGFSYCPCIDYPYYLFFRRYIGISAGCRFLISEVDDFVSKLQLIFDFLLGIVILIYINWGVSGVVLIIKVTFFVQKNYLKKKDVIATVGEMKGIESITEKVDALYGMCNCSINLGFKLATYMIISHSTFTSDFRSHPSCIIDSYIGTNLDFLDNTLKDVLTNVFVNLALGSFNFLLALVSFVNCCIETKKQVKEMTAEDKQKFAIVLAKII